MSHILLTGFTPFDGREYNASWIAARALVGQHRSEHILHGLEVPVCWGMPKTALAPALEKWRPSCIIALGEGASGVFKIETLARNVRAIRQDNNGQLPAPALNDPTGPDTRPASAAYETLAARLSQTGYPIQLSSDAGAYLCEEMLYTLETLRSQHDFLQIVLFVHVPPFGTAVEIQGVSRVCDEGLLLEFAVQLLECVSSQLLQNASFEY